MTEQEKKLFEGLREKGWFTGAEAPELLLSFDVSDRRIPPMIEKAAKNRIFTVLSGLISLHLKFVWITLRNL